MNTHASWTIDPNSSADIYCTKEETIASVIENFNIRRLYSAEGVAVTIDGVSENVLIQDHSNPLNENKSDKKIHVPMESVLTTGSYVIYNYETWLAISRVDIVDNAYKSAQIIKCNYNLHFLSSLLQPLSRHCLVTRTRSGTDVNGNPVQIELGDGILSLTLPYDSETSLLDRTYPDGGNQRLLVDFGSTTPRAYNVTDADRLSKIGCVILTLEECERSVNDSVQNMIADYDRYEAIPSEVIPETGKCTITFNGEPEIRVGLAAKKFIGKFYDSNGDLLEVTPVWNLVIPNTALLDKIITVIADDYITIKVTDRTLIGTPIRLELTDATESVSNFITLNIKSIG